MTAPPQSWLDLAALINPVGLCPDPLVERRTLDWYEIYRLAAGHMVAPNLYSALEAKNRLHLAPTEVREALTEFYQLNVTRNARLRAVLRDTVRILNAQGIEPLLMKGSISLLPGQGGQDDTRMMSDLDIALQNAEPEEGYEALRAAGYRHAINQGPAEYQHVHHLAPLFHPRAEAYIEIHKAVFSAKIPPGTLPLAAVCAQAEAVDWEGLRLWVPSIAHRLLHNALHQQVQDADLRFGDRCSLRQVLEFTQLRTAPAAAELAWNEIFNRLDMCGMGDPVRAYMMVAERLFAQSLPAGVELGKAARHAEKWMWFRIKHPRLSRSVVLASRLRYLPRRLVTPGWYPDKVKHLRQRWMAR